MVVAIDNFFGCYLLYCTNPKFKGRTYIGFTVNPERRIGQHNAGKHKGGAWKTSGRGPWDMALIVHGFPSDIAALRFEWAWQNPGRSRRLRCVKPKQRKESSFQFRVRVLSSMLCQTPWKKLPLIIRWLKQEYAVDLEPIPPPHMPIAYGPVTAKVKKHKVDSFAATTPQALQKPNTIEADNNDSDEECIPLMTRLTSGTVKKTKPVKATLPQCVVYTSNSSPDRICFLCNCAINDQASVHCIDENCSMVGHIVCAAKYFLADGQPFQLLPIEGTCPKCKCILVWGDLIRESQGFHQYLNAR